MWINILAALFSIIATWLVAHVYYLKSIKKQEKESTKEIKELLELTNNKSEVSKEVLRLRYIQEALDEYKRAGTPVRVIDTFDGLTNSEKSDIYDAVMMRAKGRLGKSNKYKNCS